MKAGINAVIMISNITVSLKLNTPDDAIAAGCNYSDVRFLNACG